MERQQQPHRARQSRPPIAGRTQSAHKPKAAFSLQSRWSVSLALLGSAWVVMVVIALTALSGLLSPSSSSGSQSRGTASIRRSISTAQVTDQSRLPLWLFGAIALSCVTGSMLISVQAKRPLRPRKSVHPKRLAPYVAPPATEPAFLSVSSTLPQVPTAPSVAMAPPPVPVAPTAAPFIAPATLMQLAQQRSQTTGQPTGAARAPEDTRPLDWGDASLADKLDIRKQRSISSLL